MFSRQVLQEAKAQETAMSGLAVTARAGRQRTQKEWLQMELQTRPTGLTTRKIPSRSQKV